ncbi:MAG: DUF4878 domain-containing protein [Prevotella sp.]|nr:DUF4878 domain-containing protein [Prevotella sp.]
MKKIIIAFTACMMMLAVMTSCGVDMKDPKAVAKAYFQCIKDKDYKGVVQYMGLKPEEMEPESEKDSFILKYMEEAIENKGGVSSFELGEPTIDEERGTAEIMLKVIFGDGTETENPVNLEKDDNGDWIVK